MREKKRGMDPILKVVGSWVETPAAQTKESWRERNIRVLRLRGKYFQRSRLVMQGNSWLPLLSTPKSKKSR
jgi:hypothetical protein